MANCSECGRKLWRASSEKCEACAQREREAKQSAAANAEAAKDRTAAIKRPNMIVTTESAHNLPVKQRLGVVSSHCAFGLHLIKDLFVEVRDLVGGRSATMESAIKDATDKALEGLIDQAARLGADALVGVTVTPTDFGGRAGAMVLMMATGTAVTLGDTGSISNESD